MKCLGIDYGDKRIGIAVSDENGKIAFPGKIIPNKNDSQVFDKLEVFIRLENIKKIIIGLPLTLSSADSDQTLKTRLFAKRLLNKISLPIEFENEMLTTKIAQAGSNRKTVDASAAALILQSYLDKKSKIQHP